MALASRLDLLIHDDERHSRRHLTWRLIGAGSFRYPLLRHFPLRYITHGLVPHVGDWPSFSQAFRLRLLGHDMVFFFGGRTKISRNNRWTAFAGNELKTLPNVCARYHYAFSVARQIRVISWPFWDDG